MLMQRQTHQQIVDVIPERDREHGNQHKGLQGARQEQPTTQTLVHSTRFH